MWWGWRPGNEWRPFDVSAAPQTALLICTLVMAPPLIITEPKIAELAHRLRRALDDVLDADAKG